jgi:dienelactone hydrolase
VVTVRRGTSAARSRLLSAPSIVVALVLVACGGGGGSAAAPGRSLGPALSAQSGLPVTFRTQTFVDPSRTTPAQGGVPERLSRTLVTTIATPEGPGPFPLILFSHGFSGSGEGYSDLLRALASAGYVVAAPDFPATSANAPGGPQREIDPPENQPGDVRFVLGEMLRLNADRGDPLSGRIDPRRIGAAGHSMGAGVTMGVGYNTCCRDERVRAGVLMAANTPTLYRGDWFVPPAAPVLVVHGDQDELLPYIGGRRIFSNADEPKFLLTILGGDHSSPYSGRPDPPGARVVVAATVDFFDAYLKGRPDGVSRLRADTDKPGVAKLESTAK